MIWFENAAIFYLHKSVPGAEQWPLCQTEEVSAQWKIMRVGLESQKLNCQWVFISKAESLLNIESSAGQSGKSREIYNRVGVQEHGGHKIQVVPGVIRVVGTFETGQPKLYSRTKLYKDRDKVAKKRDSTDKNGEGELQETHLLSYF